MVSIGDRFGKLTTISPTRIQTSTRNVKAWKCLCDCGKITVVAEGNLTRKVPTRSCGCGRRSKSNIPEDVAQERCRNAGYTLMKYSGITHSYSTVLCEVCGECCETRLDNLWTGYAPCRCSRAAKIRESDILERLYNLENVVSITMEEFNRGNTYCEVVFGCGHLVRRKFSKFTSVRCPVCNLKSSTPDHKIVERIKEGFTVCLDGKGIKNLTIKCHEHGELYTESIFNHEKTSGCRKCISSYKSEVYSSPLDKMLEGIGRTKFIPDISTYVNMTTKMKLLCPEGHVFYAEPVKVIHSGRGCPYCAKHGFKRAEKGRFLHKIWYNQ